MRGYQSEERFIANWGLKLTISETFCCLQFGGSNSSRGTANVSFKALSEDRRSEIPFNIRGLMMA